MAKEWADLIVIALSGIGFFTLLKPLLLHFPKWVWSVLFRPPKNLKDYGQWAVVTGCTDGIGKAFALELASKGLDLILVGRNPAKLEATANEISQRYGEKIRIKSVVVDFANMSGEEVEARIREGIHGLDVGLLVNNAGVANPYPQYLDENEPKTIEILKVNLEGATWAAKAVIPGMMKKRKGAIVNIGSGSSIVVPSYPLCTVYSSTKAYLAMLSRCMSLEYQPFGIDVQCQVPLLIATKMIRVRRSSVLVPSAEEFSRASVRWIGYNHMCTPYWPHAVQSTLLSLVPGAIKTWMLLRFFLIQRKRALRKRSSMNEGDKLKQRN